ncbi:MAG: FG-GAP repeat protein [Rhodospirillales bacterium]|nr:FG-GAP repeat protein [Alphaproteobacteria bacterium]USO02847.1 MAG: FG-GAP repeat protein [Rhodospirillales bacterium]
MAHTPHGDLPQSENSQQEGPVEVISAEGQSLVEVPGNGFISNADMSRDGNDLVLESPDGATVVVEGYFLADPAPAIESPDGGVLTPQLVDSFVRSPAQFAANSSATDESPVGAIEEVKGEATVTHADGTSDPVTIGTPVYQGDIIETSGEGAVNIVFIDETSMAISENARMAVDEYKFDSSTESGATNLSVLRGVFVFTSGLIGRDDPDDVQIDTPVGSIGIRGTIIAGHINAGGESEITVIEGAIVVKNGSGEHTLSVQFETVKLNGFNNAIEDLGVLKAQDIGGRFGSLSDVAPTFYNAIQDTAKEQGHNEEAANAEADAEAQADADTEAQTEDNGQDTFEDPQAEEIMMKDPVFHQDVQGAKEPAPMADMRHGDPAREGGKNHGPLPGTHMGPPHGEGLPPPPPPPSVINNGGGSSGSSSSSTGTPGLDLTNGAGSPGVSHIVDNINNQIGHSISAVGDANNDGYADFMFTNNSTAAGENHSYIMYGNSSGNLSGLVSTLNDTNIVSFADVDADQGELAIFANPSTGTGFDHAAISGIGDFNGDGVNDYLVGQGQNNATGNAFIVSGDNPVNSIALGGLNPADLAGHSVSAIGDIDNDGYADVIIGAPGTATNTGSAFILTGHMGTIIGTEDVSTGFTGTRVNGAAAGDRFGESVIGLGDFDSDGKSDYAVGASGHNSLTGKVSIYKSDGSTITDLFGTNVGDQFGSGLSAIGDFDGDGKSDLIIGTESTDTARLYAGGTGYEISTDAHRIMGGGGVGDFNADGYDDFAIAVENGSRADIYVVFGDDTPINMTLAELNDPSKAFKMSYEGIAAGSDISISSVGDANGDGFDDMAIGISSYDINSDTLGDGQVIVVNGREVGNTNYVRDGYGLDANGGAGNVSASANSQHLVDMSGSDNFSDNGFAGLSFRGGHGDNEIFLSNTLFQDIDGGLGYDTLRIDSSLDFSNIDYERISGIEEIYLQGSALGPGPTLTLTVENIFNMLKSSDTGELKIDFSNDFSDLVIDDGILGDPYANDDAADIATALGTLAGGAVSIGSGGGYDTFTVGGYQLLIDNTNPLTFQYVV